MQSGQVETQLINLHEFLTYLNSDESKHLWDMFPGIDIRELAKQSWQRDLELTFKTKMDLTDVDYDYPTMAKLKKYAKIWRKEKKKAIRNKTREDKEREKFGGTDLNIGVNDHAEESEVEKETKNEYEEGREEKPETLNENVDCKKSSNIDIDSEEFKDIISILPSGKVPSGYSVLTQDIVEYCEPMIHFVRLFTPKIMPISAVEEILVCLLEQPQPLSVNTPHNSQIMKKLIYPNIWYRRCNWLKLHSVAKNCNFRLSVLIKLRSIRLNKTRGILNVVETSYEKKEEKKDEFVDLGSQLVKKVFHKKKGEFSVVKTKMKNHVKRRQLEIRNDNLLIRCVAAITLLASVVKAEDDFFSVKTLNNTLQAIALISILISPIGVSDMPPLMQNLSTGISIWLMFFSFQSVIKWVYISVFLIGLSVINILSYYNRGRANRTSINMVNISDWRVRITTKLFHSCASIKKLSTSTFLAAWAGLILGSLYEPMISQIASTILLNQLDRRFYTNWKWNTVLLRIPLIFTTIVDGVSLFLEPYFAKPYTNVNLAELKSNYSGDSVVDYLYGENCCMIPLKYFKIFGLSDQIDQPFNGLPLILKNEDLVFSSDTKLFKLQKSFVNKVELGSLKMGAESINWVLDLIESRLHPMSEVQDKDKLHKDLSIFIDQLNNREVVKRLNERSSAILLGIVNTETPTV